MSRAIKCAAIAVVVFLTFKSGDSQRTNYSRVEVNFSTDVRSLEVQNNENLRNSISLLIMSKNGEVPYNLVEKMSQSIIDTSLRYQFDPLFITSVIYRESEYDPFATSTKGAVGLMQLLPKFFDRPDINLYDIDINLEKGVSELARLREKYGSYTDMLIAYLGGEELLKSYKRGEISEETAIMLDDYARIILINYQILTSRFRVRINNDLEFLSMSE